MEKQKYFIDIYSVIEKEEERIEKKISDIKDPTLSYTQKRKMVLREEKTGKYIVNNEKEQEFFIDISAVYELEEKKIEKKIEELNKDYPNLSYDQKKALVLMQEKTTTFDMDDKLNKDNEKCLSNSTSTVEEEQIINDNDLEISSRKKNKNDENSENAEEWVKEKKIDDDEDKLKTSNINDSYNDMTRYGTTFFDDNFKRQFVNKEQLLIVDNLNNTTRDETNIINNSQSQISNLNDDSSTLINYNNIMINKEKEKEKEEKKTDKDKNNKRIISSRTDFYLKSKLYDFPLNKNESDMNLPEKYGLHKDDEHYIYACKDDLTTYRPISCALFMINKNSSTISDVNCKGENGCKYNENLGLFFCGKNIEIKGKNGIENKRCSPNEFICKDCMLSNKKLYKLNDDFLININGRVAYNKKSSYHCYGHFLVGNEIKDCIKFKCKACKMLDSLSDYYK
jgi:hypothetical protein